MARLEQGSEQSAQQQFNERYNATKAALTKAVEEGDTKAQIKARNNAFEKIHFELISLSKKQFSPSQRERLMIFKSEYEKKFESLIRELDSKIENAINKRRNDAETQKLLTAYSYTVFYKDQKDLEIIANIFYNFTNLKIIFVTGTNGKTSIAYGANRLFNLNGNKS